VHTQGVMYMKPIWFIFSELQQGIPSPATLSVAIVVGSKPLQTLKLMGWIHTRPQHLMPLPAPLFIHCLVYFMRYILRYMRELVRLTSLLHLWS